MVAVLPIPFDLRCIFFMTKHFNYAWLNFSKLRVNVFGKRETAVRPTLSHPWVML